MAKDLRALYSDAKIYGIDVCDAHLDEAVSLGLIDDKATYEDLADADLVVVSIPVDSLVKELPLVLESINDDTLVIDDREEDDSQEVLELTSGCESVG